MLEEGALKQKNKFNITLPISKINYLITRFREVNSIIEALSIRLYILSYKVQYTRKICIEKQQQCLHANHLFSALAHLRMILDVLFQADCHILGIFWLLA